MEKLVIYYWFWILGVAIGLLVTKALFRNIWRTDKFILTSMCLTSWFIIFCLLVITGGRLFSKRDY